MATPILSATPALTATYNPSMADTFSWVPMEGAGRPLFARATYVVGSGVTLNAGDITLDLTSVESKLDTVITLLQTLTAQGAV